MSSHFDFDHRPQHRRRQQNILRSSTTMVTPVAVVAPLTLSTVKTRNPRLFREYAALSDRYRETKSPASTPPSTIETLRKSFRPIRSIFHSRRNRRVTNIFISFIECYPPARPVVVAATPLGSFKSWRPHWKELCCIRSLHPNLPFSTYSDGRPRLTQSVFALAAKEWKKLFEKMEVNGAIPGVSEELCNFAISVCDLFHKLLKSQWKIHGEHAKYSFYFIKPKSRGGGQQHKPLGMEAIAKEPVEKEPKKHAGKKPKVSTETNGCIDGPINLFVAGKVVCADDIMAATVAARTAIDTPPDPNAKSSSTSHGLRSKGVGFYDNSTIISITIQKRGKSAKLGLGLTKVAGPAQCSAMKVTTIFESSLFYNTGLRIGMIIFLVNGTIYTDFDHGLEMLQNEKGKLSIVAAFPRQGGMIDSTDSKSTVASAGTINTTPGAGPIFVSFPPIFHCIAGVN